MAAEGETMELIDRYVKAVAIRLPRKRRADVEAELRSAILDALEGRGATTDDDVAAVLREFGDPATVAASYEPEGQYLIGPDLYPAFRRVLGQALAAVLALAGLWMAVQLATGTADPWAAGEVLMHGLGLAYRAAIGTVVGIAAAFVVMQRLGVAKSLRKRDWDPRTLPALLDADRVSRVEAAFSLVLLALALAIISAIAREAMERLGDAPDALRPLVRDAILRAIPWLVASILVEAVMHAGLLLEGRRRQWTRVLHVASDALAVVAFSIAAVAVLTQREALHSLGMPEIAVKIVLAGLLLIAVTIAVSAVSRERKLSRRRARERAGADRAEVPLPVA